MPSTPTNRRKPSSFLWQAVNKSNITTYGEQSVTLNLGLRRTFRWIFVLEDVHTPISGVDFLRHFALMVDVKNCRFIDSETILTVRGIQSANHSPSPTYAFSGGHSPYHALLQQFPDIMCPCYKEAAVKHNVTHHIITKGPRPTYCKTKAIIS